MSGISTGKDYHYVYRITNTRLNKHYYGVRTSKNGICPKDDIGVIYFSSSADREFMKDQKSIPEDYRYKIVRISETRDLAAQLEIKLHGKFAVGVNPNFYNRCRATSIGFSLYGIPVSQESRDKSSRTQMSRSLEEKAIISAKISATSLNRTPAQKSRTSRKLRDAIKNLSVEQRAAKSKKLSNSWKNKSSDKKAEVIAKRVFTHANKSDKEKAIAGSKMSKTKMGAKNPNAVTVAIYDSAGILQYVCHGGFLEFCKERNLPFAFLKKCYIKELTGFKKGKSHHDYFEKYKHHEGWYARKIDK